MKENGCGNIYNESDIEAIDIVDEEADSYDLKQLVILNSRLDKNANVPPIRKISEQVDEKMCQQMIIVVIQPNIIITVRHPKICFLFISFSS